MITAVFSLQLYTVLSLSRLFPHRLKKQTGLKTVYYEADGYNKESETSPKKVKISAVQTLKSMPPSSAGVAWANKTALITDEPKEQELLVSVIGENLKTCPENEKTLRELLKKEPDNRVKREIYKYIVPK